MQILIALTKIVTTNIMVRNHGKDFVVIQILMILK